MKKFIILFFTLTICRLTYAQDSNLKISGYLETYYLFDFNKPAENNRPGFIYSHNRHNEVNLNLGFIKAAYDNNAIRANLALAAGTYINANYAVEPGVLKNIFEANAGVKLSKTANLWVDAGIFASHIGFESAISKDCWALTRNIVSENTPYYESGAKISYTTTDNKLTATGLFLNGWQRITRPDNSSKPAGGVQLTYKPNDKLTFNYSNYLGKEGPDSVNVTRFYHNFYSIIQLNEALGLTLGFDYGTQQISKENKNTTEVISPVALLRYQFADKWAVTGRYEYYQDQGGIFIPTDFEEGFKTSGYSLNVDFSPVKQAVIRLEGKVYDSAQKVFTRNNGTVKNNGAITASIAVAF